MRIVQTQSMYTYEKLCINLQALALAYPKWIAYDSLGKTIYNREIWCLRLGKGAVPLFLNGAHHGREWLTSLLLMKMVEEYSRLVMKQEVYEQLDLRQLLEEVTLWIVPMVNPDGVTLQQFGVQAFPIRVHQQLLEFNLGSRDFTRWKANGEGIDLNRQYPARWAEIQDDMGRPCYKQYKGRKPLEANEAKWLVELTYAIEPRLALAYHSAGKVLYWYFHNSPQTLARDCRLANQFAMRSGYRLVQPELSPNGGGYTDWFIETFQRPGFTPELGYYPGERHLPLHCFQEELHIHLPLVLWLAREAPHIST
ncbi:M14 family zinc carboxypeptidase [Rubeoparvulum massiliense]|uniref:M14 family zinc carboxypeptidase n=1 Tax=Rubeoparvulum massiliense TaxID=1631346 RepID=UPI00065E0557|nr:M14 family zinc carboxypeptidase [Rubeoparvulum massiliense]